MYNKINIAYNSTIDEEEKKIFEDALGKDNLIFSMLRTKGMLGAAFDVNIVVDWFNNPALTAIINGAVLIELIKKIFYRNTRNIMDNNSRPRYTILTFRMAKSWITVSNVNQENKIIISKVSSDFQEIKKQIGKGVDEYSDEKFIKYLENL